MKTLLAAVLTLSTSAALAQSPASPQPEVEQSTTVPSPETQSEASKAEASTDATDPSADERITTTEGKVGSIEEQLLEMKSDLGALKKLKLSGYVQARYQNLQRDEVDGTLFNEGQSSFLVRRARLKATYTGEVGALVLQLDAVPSGVSIKDAEATLFIPGTKQTWGITAGQTKWPFSYEVVQSSSDREFPERTRVVRAFAAGERDRGIKVNGRMGFLRLNVGVFDGNGTDYRSTGAVGAAASSAASSDNDKEKDVIGRVSFDKKWIAGGVSGWYGKTLRRGGVLNGVSTPREHFDRTRVGADLQIYLDVLPVGATALKGEFIAGKSYLRSGAEQFGVPAHGWYALLVQNIGLENVVAVRYDVFDGANGVDNAASASGAVQRLGSSNQVGTLGLLASHYFGGDVKLTAAYELPMTGTVDGNDAEDPKDNLFTLQLQAKF